MGTNKLEHSGIAAPDFPRRGNCCDEEYGILKDLFLKGFSCVKGYLTAKILIPTGFALLIFLLFWTGVVGFGYNAYLNNKYLGAVRDRNKIKALASEAETLSPAPMKSGVNLFPRLVFFGGTTADGDIVKNILLADGQMFSGTALRLGGEIIFAADTEAEVSEIIDSYTAPYITENTVSAKIEGGVIEDGIHPLSLKMPSYDAHRRLSDIAPSVITTENISVSEAVARPVETVEDGTIRAGNVVVKNEGADGEKEVMKVITKRNGETMEEDVLFENILAAPVAKVEIVGTKIPDGRGSGVFQRPVNGEVTSNFGFRWGRSHNGTDFAGNTGDAVLAADGGTVTFSGQENGFGNLIIIDHKNGYETYYAHLSARYISTGDKVDSGEVIGAVGNTGNSTGPHLHLEIHKNGTPVNPMDYLK